MTFKSLSRIFCLIYILPCMTEAKECQNHDYTILLVPIFFFTCFLSNICQYLMILFVVVSYCIIYLVFNNLFLCGIWLCQL